MELDTASPKVPDVSPIAAVSFKWGTVQPEIVSQGGIETTKRIYGVGQCIFKMYHSNIKCKIQTAFQRQTLLPTVHFIRYLNENGQPAEQERYEYENVLITNYECICNEDGVQIDTIQITSRGDYRYVQVIRENGKRMGQIVSEVPYYGG